MAVTVTKLVAYLLLLFFVGLPGCSQQEQGDSPLLAKINDFDLPLAEFQTQLSEELELDNDFKVTREAKKAFLEDLIRKELLIQEAKRLKLDTKEQFVRTIQRYWESTLIRNLLELKGTDISKKIYVSEDEIKARYGKMAQSSASAEPPPEVREEIIEDLKVEKKTQMLETWMDELKQKASVHVVEELL